MEMELSAYVLIGELLADPAKFKQRGKSEELFQGHSDRLNPGKGNEDVTARKPLNTIQRVRPPPAGSESCMGGGNTARKT